MKRTFKVTELNHDELVSWLSGATYGNTDLVGISVETEPEQFDKTHTECMEDLWAEVLVQGGTIRIHDFGATESLDYNEIPTKADYYTAKAKSKLANSQWGQGSRKFYTPDYIVNLADLLKGISCEKASEYIQDLFINKDGDMWTCYNLLQIAVFGEVVYG